MARNLLPRVTALSRNNRMRVMFRYGGHRGAGTAKQATAGHPDGDADCKNFHCEKRAHSALESTPERGFCRELRGLGVEAES